MAEVTGTVLDIHEAGLAFEAIVESAQAQVVETVGLGQTLFIQLRAGDLAHRHPLNLLPTQHTKLYGAHPLVRAGRVGRGKREVRHFQQAVRQHMRGPKTARWTEAAAVGACVQGY